MKAKLLKTWRDRIQSLIGRALEEADRQGLRGKDRERFIRRVPPEVKGSRWITQVWHSEMRAMFGRLRVPPPDPRRPQLPLS